MARKVSGRLVAVAASAVAAAYGVGYVLTQPEADRIAADAAANPPPLALDAALFFAFFMLTDPPTSPNALGEQVEFGFVVGLASIFVFLVVQGLAFLLLGLLVGNVWLALRRYRQGRQAYAQQPVDSRRQPARGR